ncbi:MAG: thiol peroxidase [Nitrospirae bacterium]|nr:thiol peroxidase [Nitrospirota bacterium]
MAEITFKGSPVNTIGELPKAGEQAPDFVLTKTDLSDISLKDLAGKRAVLNIFISVDTSVCAASVRRFNAEVDKLKNTVVLCVSLDLPFALSRFCGAEGLNNVIPVSELRNRSFGNRYGVRIAEGPLAGLLARSVVIIDEKGKVIYTELVKEIAEEPDYEKALQVLR